MCECLIFPVCVSAGVPMCMVVCLCVYDIVCRFVFAYFIPCVCVSL